MLNDEILKIGIEQDRVILTADKLFKANSQGWRHSVLVSGGKRSLKTWHIFLQTME